jgi:hypothetical protein
MPVALRRMLELYYLLHDDDSQRAMEALGNQFIDGGNFEGQNYPYKGNLRAMGQSKIEAEKKYRIGVLFLEVMKLLHRRRQFFGLLGHRCRLYTHRGL